MRNQKKLILEQLDRKLEPFKGIEKVHVPATGWINNIRTALNMTLQQLGNRLNMTKQGIKKIEERESSESISIKSLKKVGKELDMYFVYGFVPIHGSVENLVDKNAHILARKIVLRTSQNMKLENQGNSEERINQAIDELASEIKREMPKYLWD
ncbi:MAG: mobile mystery protein A [Ignavibacteria bacterium]|nr:mobile mystery protein A [Ignavibacteria bacterium]